MKIAIVGPFSTADTRHLLDTPGASLPHGYSGAPLLVTLVTELIRRGHHVTAITLSNDMHRDSQQHVHAQGRGFKIVYVPMRPRAWRPNGWLPGRIVDLYAFERRGLRAAIREAAPDVVHAHWSYEFAWAAQTTGLPTVITCHDSPFLVARMTSSERPTRSLYRWLRAGMAWHVLRRASRLTAVSPYMQDEIKALSSCPIVVVPNPLPRVLSDKPKPLAHYPNADKPVVAMVANGWGKRKNAHVAIQAFMRFHRHKPDARLKMYGSGYEPGGQAERWAQNNGGTQGMEFVGSVPYAVLLDDLARADLVVHPSLEETFGMSVAEAMALGVPVVAGASSGAVPWVVGEGGILVDVTSAEAIEEAMLELIASPERYQQIALAARERAVTHFSADKVVAAYEAVYSDALTEAGQETRFPAEVLR